MNFRSIAAAAALTSGAGITAADFMPSIKYSSYTKTTGQRTIARSSGRYTPHHGANVRYTTDSKGNIRRHKA